MKKILLLASLVLVLGSIGCGRAPGPVAGAPPYDSEVKDTDVCQPVRKEGGGGDYIRCGGKVCNLSTLTCGQLSERKKGSTQNWLPIAPDGPYDPAKEYRCTCK